MGLIDPTGRKAQERRDDHAMDVIHGQDDLRIHFGPAPAKKTEEDRGHRHDVVVFLSDTIYQFKRKLTQACEKEAKAEGNIKQQTPQTKARREKYLQVARGMTYRHAVMVFVPSQRLRELAQQLHTGGEQLTTTGIANKKEHEYKRLYRVEESDPSSWQPLDTIRSFDHYQTMYGFGMALPQRLRITEGSDDYK